ncbi:MAG: thioredoxin [Candidatus Woesearchaeota archaeon]
MPIELNNENFESEVLKSDKPVIVDFWAPWCGPCRILGPRFEELSKEMTDVKFCKVNVDENQDLAEKYNIMSIPTLVLFDKGQVKGNIIGAMSKDSLKEKIKMVFKV